MSFIDIKVEQYLNKLMPIEDSLLKEIYQDGITNEVPIIQVPSIRLIQTLLKVIKPKIIIEIGTAIGFSAIWLARAFPEAIVHTIERKPKMANKARENIKRADLTNRIILHEGEAIEILPTLPNAELIFVDAAKGQYKEFFNLSYPLLRVGGVFVFDNILFRGYVADGKIVQEKPMLRKISDFNDFIATHEKLDTSFIPIGDGLAISYKMED